MGQPKPIRRPFPLKNLADSCPGIQLVGARFNKREVVFGLTSEIDKLHT